MAGQLYRHLTDIRCSVHRYRGLRDVVMLGGSVVTFPVFTCIACVARENLRDGLAFHDDLDKIALTVN